MCISGPRTAARQCEFDQSNARANAAAAARTRGQREGDGRGKIWRRRTKIWRQGGGRSDYIDRGLGIRRIIDLAAEPAGTSVAAAAATGNNGRGLGGRGNGVDDDDDDDGQDERNGIGSWRLCWSHRVCVHCMRECACPRVL